MQIHVGPPGWHERNETPTVIAEFSSDYTWTASAIFNANAFPNPATHTFVQAAADQLALLHYARDLVAKEVLADREPFLTSLNIGGDLDEMRHFPKHTIFFRNMAFQAGLFGALISLKSSLDIYAKLVSVLIAPSKKAIDGFNRTNVDGKDIRGGHFLVWLQKQTSFSNAPDLREIVALNIRSWLDEAIKYRDDAVHFGRVPQALGSSLVVNKPVAEIVQEDIQPPRMPNGQPVDTYCALLYARYKTFLKETLPLIPEVKLDLLNFD